MHLDICILPVCLFVSLSVGPHGCSDCLLVSLSVGLHGCSDCLFVCFPVCGTAWLFGLFVCFTVCGPRGCSDCLFVSLSVGPRGCLDCLFVSLSVDPRGCSDCLFVSLSVARVAVRTVCLFEPWSVVPGCLGLCVRNTHISPLSLPVLSWAGNWPPATSTATMGHCRSL